MDQKPIYIKKKCKPICIVKKGDFLRDNNGVRLASEKFSGPGILKGYADWCPHCQDKVDAMIELAKKNTAFKVYVMESSKDENEHLNKAINLEGFPNFFNVDASGYVVKLPEIHSVNDIKNYYGLV